MESLTTNVLLSLHLQINASSVLPLISRFCGKLENFLEYGCIIYHLVSFAVNSFYFHFADTFIIRSRDEWLVDLKLFSSDVNGRLIACLCFESSLIWEFHGRFPCDQKPLPRIL
jgi:hypothetical protein